MFILSSHLLKASTSRSLMQFSYRCLATTKKKDEFRFSESSAFHGIDKDRNDPLGLKNRKRAVTSADESQEHRMKRFFVGIASITALAIYFYFIKEPTEIDALLQMPPEQIQALFTRKTLLEEIEANKKIGNDTSLLEAKLDYLEIEIDSALTKIKNDQK